MYRSWQENYCLEMFIAQLISNSEKKEERDQIQLPLEDLAKMRKR
jgi:hypothetical protein